MWWFCIKAELTHLKCPLQVFPLPKDFKPCLVLLSLISIPRLYALVVPGDTFLTDIAFQQWARRWILNLNHFSILVKLARVQRVEEAKETLHEVGECIGFLGVL